MKLKLLFSATILILFVNFVNYAQTSASANNIAIQGIARDADGNAKTGVILSLTFEIYYNAGINNPITVFTEPKNLKTDAFGVFSHIINPGVINNSKIANYQMYLKITESTGQGVEFISNEKLNHVPYAIAANNGVPTGSIMPFLGTDAPEGWALCNGDALPVDGSADNLIAMIGANAPDLQGMFLRGTGTNPVNSQDGPALMATQNDAFKAHLHDSGTLANNTTGQHNHQIARGAGIGASNKDDGANADNQRSGNIADDPIKDAGNHTHIISGSTAETGDLETRPVNYGVNYIIKL